MREETRPSGEEIAAVDAATEKITKGPNRRTFLGQVSSAAAVLVASATVGGPCCRAGERRGRVRK
jgi:hypothetical protein